MAHKCGTNTRMGRYCILDEVDIKKTKNMKLELAINPEHETTGTGRERDIYREKYEIF